MESVESTRNKLVGQVLGQLGHNKDHMRLWIRTDTGQDSVIRHMRVREKEL